MRRAPNMVRRRASRGEGVATATSPLVPRRGRRGGRAVRGRHFSPEASQRRRAPWLLAAALLAAGAFLLAYPLLSDYFYGLAATQVIAEYDSAASEASNEEVARQFELAQEYNEALKKAKVILTDPFDPTAIQDEAEDYDSIFNLSGDGIIGHVEIPKIGVDLPIYHGTSSSVLEEGVGHMSNSSLPTGEPGTHVVLTGHTGLTKARLFTDLTELEEGDVFYVKVLGRTMAYRVDQISVVEPSDISELQVVEGREYVTLLTCYPYGVNSHRLLVRGAGITISEAQEAEQVTSEASVWESQYVRAILLCLAVYVPLTVVAIVALRRRRDRGTGGRRNLSHAACGRGRRALSRRR